MASREPPPPPPQQQQQQPQPPQQQHSEVHDCFECRMIGTGSMLAFSGYFVYLAHIAPVASTNRRFSAVCSVCFAMAGVARFLA
jgi:hypothetical protein